MNCILFVGCVALFQKVREQPFRPVGEVNILIHLEFVIVTTWQKRRKKNYEKCIRFQLNDKHNMQSAFVGGGGEGGD